MDIRPMGRASSGPFPRRPLKRVETDFLDKTLRAFRVLDLGPQGKFLGGIIKLIRSLYVRGNQIVSEIQWHHGRLTKLEAEIAGYVDPSYGEAREERIDALELRLQELEKQLQGRLDSHARHLRYLDAKVKETA